MKLCACISLACALQENMLAALRAMPEGLDVVYLPVSCRCSVQLDNGHITSRYSRVCVGLCVSAYSAQQRASEGVCGRGRGRDGSHRRPIEHRVHAAVECSGEVVRCVLCAQGCCLHRLHGLHDLHCLHGLHRLHRLHGLHDLHCLHCLHCLHGLYCLHGLVGLWGNCGCVVLLS